MTFLVLFGQKRLPDLNPAENLRTVVQKVRDPWQKLFNFFLIFKLIKLYLYASVKCVFRQCLRFFCSLFFFFYKNSTADYYMQCTQSDKGYNSFTPCMSFFNKVLKRLSHKWRGVFENANGSERWQPVQHSPLCPYLCKTNFVCLSICYCYHVCQYSSACVAVFLPFCLSVWSVG